MGIFKGLFRTRDAPQNRTVGSSYSFFMGGSASGKQVNERTSMQTFVGLLIRNRSCPKRLVMH